MNENLFISSSIFLKGDQLNPDYVSETLGIQSFKSRKKGEIKKSSQPNAKMAIAKFGVWQGCKIKSKTRTVSDIISEVLQMFDGHQEPLEKIAGVDEAYLDIFVIRNRTNGSDNVEEFILNKDQILRISQLGLAVYVTVSFSDDE